MIKESVARLIEKAKKDKFFLSLLILYSAIASWVYFEFFSQVFEQMVWNFVPTLVLSVWMIGAVIVVIPIVVFITYLCWGEIRRDMKN